MNTYTIVYKDYDFKVEAESPEKAKEIALDNPKIYKHDLVLVFKVDEFGHHERVL